MDKDYGPLVLIQMKPLKLRFVHEQGMAPDPLLMDQVSNWCAEHGCGRRTAYDIFEFKNKQEVLIFTLRWQ